MTIGTSVFLMAVGAILRFAVSDAIEGVDLSVVGLILMLAGAVGLVIGIWMTLAARRRYPAEAPAADPYAGDRVVTREPPPPATRY
jgi:hypothetical protein